MPTAVTRSTRLAIRRLNRAINHLLGYPRLESEATGARRVGGGRHVPWSEVVTRRHARVLRMGARFAIVRDAVVQALHGRTVTVVVDGTPSTITVDVTASTEEIDLGAWAVEDTDADDAL